MRFLNIGDRDESDFETLLGLLELARNRESISVDGKQTVLSAEHVEIGIGYTNNQVLLRGFTIGFGPRHDLVCLPEAHDLVPAKQRLPEVELPAGRLVLDFGLKPERNDDKISGSLRLFYYRVLNARTGRFCLCPVGPEAYLREQHAASLRFRFERSKPARLGFVNSRVALQCLLVDLEQRGGLAGHGCREHCGCSQ